MSAKTLTFKTKQRPGEQQREIRSVTSQSGAKRDNHGNNAQKTQNKDKYSPAETMRRRKKKHDKHKIIEFVPNKEPERNLGKHLSLRDDDETSEVVELGTKRRKKAQGNEKAQGNKSVKKNDMDIERERSLALIAMLSYKQEKEVDDKIARESEKNAVMEEKARKRDERKQKEKMIQEAMLQAVLTEAKAKKRAARELERQERERKEEIEEMASTLSAKSEPDTTASSKNDSSKSSVPLKSALKKTSMKSHPVTVLANTPEIVSMDAIPHPFEPSEASKKPTKSILKKSSRKGLLEEVKSAAQAIRQLQLDVNHVETSKDESKDEVKSEAKIQEPMQKELKKTALKKKATLTSKAKVSSSSTSSSSTKPELPSSSTTETVPSNKKALSNVKPKVSTFKFLSAANMRI